MSARATRSSSAQTASTAASVNPPEKTARAVEQRGLGGTEELVGPLHDIAQGPVAFAAAPAAQQPEAVVEPTRDGCGRQGCRAGCGQLNASGMPSRCWQISRTAGNSSSSR